MLLNDPNKPYLKSLSTCRDKVAQEGFTEEFSVAGHDLLAVKQGKHYPVHSLEVVNCFHFGAVGEADGAAVLFVLAAPDGIKGTLVDTFTSDSPPVTQLLHRCAKRND